MKNQKIQEMSSEALLKRKKTTEVVTGTLAGMLTMLLIAAVFLSLRKEFAIGFPLLVMTFSMIPILVININDIKGVKKELQARNQVV